MSGAVCDREVTILPHQRRGGPPSWLVSCLCGFLVTDLGTRDAAEDTRLHHLGLPSTLGDDLGSVFPDRPEYAAALAADLLAANDEIRRPRA